MAHKLNLYTVTYSATVSAHDEDEAVDYAAEDLDTSNGPDHVELDVEDYDDCDDSECPYNEDDDEDN